jgi:release factor glutamine methyltransferase
MQAVFGFFYRLFGKALVGWYLKRDTSFSHDNFRLKVFKGVFHPQFFFSTKFLYQFVNQLELEGSNFLEVGSGSGLISLLAHRKKAKVTAVDIDPRAIENTRYNFDTNFKGNHSAIILQSDLFESVPPTLFDVIVVNPPYFFKQPVNNSQKAWYCGENGEYFDGFYSALHGFLHPSTKIFMVLASNCDIDRIKMIAGKYGFSLVMLSAGRILWEDNYIFEIRH